LLVLIGLIGGSLPFLLFFKGLSLTSAAQGSFWHKTMFIYVALLAGLFLKEKIDKKFLLGGLLVLIGNLILLKQLPIKFNQGDFLVILATLFWAIENTISKYLLRDLAGRQLAWARMFFGSLFIFLYLIFSHQLFLVFALNLKQIIWILITAILLLFYVLSWYAGLKLIPVSQATVILLLGSPITTFLNLFSSGKISLKEIISGLLIFLGIIIIFGIKKISETFRQLIYVRT
jgi:drug/metabolite transporter (DMT)-like permease